VLKVPVVAHLRSFHFHDLKRQADLLMVVDMLPLMSAEAEGGNRRKSARGMARFM